MDNDDYIKRMEKDIEEIKDDVKKLLAYMESNKSVSKRETVIISGCMSIVVAVLSIIGKSL